MTTDKVLHIGVGSSDPAPLQRAAEIVRRGGVVVCPTSGLYGLAADPFNADAVRRVYAIKGRPAHMPLLVLIDRPEILPRLAAEIPAAAQALMTRHWPGGLTLVVPAVPGLPPALTGGTAAIGIRQTAHPLARALAAAAGGAVTGTSANRSGRPGCSRIDQLDPEVAAAVDLILDYGELEGGPGSTVVDCSVSPPAVLRQGAVPTADLGL